MPIIYCGLAAPDVCGASQIHSSPSPRGSDVGEVWPFKRELSPVRNTNASGRDSSPLHRSDECSFLIDLVWARLRTSPRVGGDSSESFV